MWPCLCLFTSPKLGVSEWDRRKKRYAVQVVVPTAQAHLVLWWWVFLLCLRDNKTSTPTVIGSCFFFLAYCKSSMCTPLLVVSVCPYTHSSVANLKVLSHFWVKTQDELITETMQRLHLWIVSYSIKTDDIVQLWNRMWSHEDEPKTAVLKETRWERSKPGKLSDSL